MFTGRLRVEINRPDGTVTRHVCRNTLTDEFLDFVAAKLGGDQTRVLTASDWELVFNAVGAGTPPAIDAGDGSMAADVSFAGGEITVTASVTYPDVGERPVGPDVRARLGRHQVRVHLRWRLGA